MQVDLWSDSKIHNWSDYKYVSDLKPDTSLQMIWFQMHDHSISTYVTDIMSKVVLTEGSGARLRPAVLNASQHKQH